MSHDTNQDVDAQNMIRYLHNHPDFLQHNIDIIESQNFDHACGDAASIMELQVKLLRERLHDYTNKLSELLQTARHNDVQFERTKLLVTELAGCTSVKAVTQALRFNFFSEFNADAIRLVMLQDMEMEFPDLVTVPEQHPDHQTWVEMARNPWATCRQVETPLLQSLLAHNDTIAMRSCAILPMHKDKQPFALIVVASQRADYYTDQLDTLFLNHVAAVCGRVLARVGVST